MSLYGGELSDLEFKSLENYITYMSNPPIADEYGVIDSKCYCGTLEIMAALEKYGEEKVQIIVYNYKIEEKLVPIKYPEDEKQIIIHLLHQGAHYDLLLAEDDPVQET